MRYSPRGRASPPRDDGAGEEHLSSKKVVVQLCRSRRSRRHSGELRPSTAEAPRSPAGQRVRRYDARTRHTHAPTALRTLSPHGYVSRTRTAQPTHCVLSTAAGAGAGARQQSGYAMDGDGGHPKKKGTKSERQQARTLGKFLAGGASASIKPASASASIAPVSTFTCPSTASVAAPSKPTPSKPVPAKSRLRLANKVRTI